MRILKLTLCVMAVALVCIQGASWAARAPETTKLPVGDVVEVIVFEVDGCTYCGFIRRDVLPGYLLQPRSGEVPMRFVDLNDGVMGLRLDAPIDMVPTAVLVKNNREAGRIVGYPGPERFFQMIGTLLTRVETNAASSR